MSNCWYVSFSSKRRLRKPGIQRRDRRDFESSAFSSFLRPFGCAFSRASLAARAASRAHAPSASSAVPSLTISRMYSFMSSSSFREPSSSSSRPSFRGSSSSSSESSSSSPPPPRETPPATPPDPPLPAPRFAPSSPGIWNPDKRGLGLVWHTAVSIAASALLVFSRLALLRATRASASVLIAARTISRKSSSFKNQGRYICAEVTATFPVASSRVANFTPSGYSDALFLSRAPSFSEITTRLESPATWPVTETFSNPRSASRRPAAPPTATTCTSGEENTGVSAGGLSAPARRGHSPTETFSRSTARAETTRSKRSRSCSEPSSNDSSNPRYQAPRASAASFFFPDSRFVFSRFVFFESVRAASSPPTPAATARQLPLVSG